MTSDSSEMRSRLSKVKGLGIAHHGFDHWWLQRVTSVALIPLTLWFTVSLISCLLAPNVVKVAEWFSSPFNTTFIVLLLWVAFVHARLGIQVIIEDYVKGSVNKYGALLLNTFLSYLFMVISIVAALKLHFIDVAASM